MNNRKLLFTAVIGLTAATMLVATLNATAPKGAANQADDGSLFAALTPVLRHPRCLNCHSTGDFPRQGDDGHPHTMNVRRGPVGMGVTAEKCTTCHQDYNLAGQHLPPGAPGWHLPPPATPMIWQGHSNAEICKQITDPKQNGGRSIALIVKHMTEDKLVLWGWNPGEGRKPVPMSHDEFSAKVKAWAAAGAHCPAK